MAAIVKTERDVWIHGELLHTSQYLLEKGQETEAGAYHQFLASLMFSAFGFEAYLNWLGAEIDPQWNAIERCFNTEEKLNFIAERLCITVDLTRRPVKTLKRLFRFRNTIAHGKRDPSKPLETKTFEKRYTTNGVPKFIKTDWESFSDRQNVEQVLGDVRKVIELLHASSGVDCDPFSLGSQTRSALCIPEGYRHIEVKIAKPELLQQERKSYEADGWKFYKSTNHPNEGFGAIFIRQKKSRNRLADLAKDRG